MCASWNLTESVSEKSPSPNYYTVGENVRANRIATAIPSNKAHQSLKTQSAGTETPLLWLPPHAGLSNPALHIQLEDQQVGASLSSSRHLKADQTGRLLSKCFSVNFRLKKLGVLRFGQGFIFKQFFPLLQVLDKGVDDLVFLTPRLVAVSAARPSSDCMNASRCSFIASETSTYLMPCLVAISFTSSSSC